MNPLTKEHILMFAKAELPWTPKVGDWYYDKVWKLFKIVDSGSIIFIEANQKRYLFLHSTDQLAEMWGEAKKEEGKNSFDFLKAVLAFISHSLSYGERTMNSIYWWPLNIIALHFVQSDLHGKVWSEKEEGWWE